MKLLALTLATSILVFFSPDSLSDEVDNFLAATFVPTYDCPSDEVFQQANAFLDTDNLNPRQKVELQLHQAHGQICLGQGGAAEPMLKEIIAGDVDTSARYYALAQYMLGFIYDVNEDVQRCDYYQTAKMLSGAAYSDIFVSASLGLITVCEPNIDASIKLGRLYGLLEHSIETKRDSGAIAQVHNNIGLYYGQIGQHALAAEQFLKAHELNLASATGSNKLSILVSGISSLMAAGEYDRAAEQLDEFSRINASVNTPLTNFWEHFSKAGYYYRTAQYAELRLSLNDWNTLRTEVESPVRNGLFRWYTAALCMHESDTQCLQDYLAFEDSAAESFKHYTRRNKYYLKFKVDIYQALGDFENMSLATERFSETLMNMARQQQSSGQVLGVANLHNQVIDLENSLANAEAERRQVIWFVVISISLLLFTILHILRAKRQERLSIDPITQLLNNEAVRGKIAALPAPSEGKINALALFDLANFREVNLQLGSNKGDYILQEIAKTFKQVTRDSDVLGRFAPEQFILCLSDMEEEVAKSFFDRIQTALDATSFGTHKGKDICVRSSTTIYISSERFLDVKEVLDDMLLALSLQNNRQMK